jgi:DNA-binding NtrC family response regulator
MENKRRILVADDEVVILKILQNDLMNEGYSVDIVEDGEKAIDKIKHDNYDLIILDNKMPKKNGMDVLRYINIQKYNTIVIMMTAYGTITSAVEAMKLGAYDYISKPFDTSEIIKKVDKILSVEKKEISKMDFNNGKNKFIGSSKEIATIKNKVNKIKDLDTTILITGESGTGKGVIAKEIHEVSYRNKKPFVHVNCAVLPANLIESELFGHTKGSFTGAVDEKKGKFELADEGTIFLDEISTLNHDLQAKLLTVLQEKKFEKIGSSKTIKVKARIIAATNTNLEEEVKANNFREDLYYRLNVINIECPPLRYRKDDIVELSMFLTNKINNHLHKDVELISDEVWDVFKSYHWPGNVRELENTLESTIALSDGKTLLKEDLPLRIKKKTKTIECSDADNHLGTLHNHEIVAIEEALQRNNGHREKTANELGISRRALQYKLKKLNLLD